jgi:fructose-1,6-bisphosphatase/inositol monophosphatase family enzyme
VQEAGAIAKKFFRNPLKHWTKGLGDSPVSEADIASNDLLQKRLVEPGDGWLSEESENDPTRLEAAASGWSIRSTARALTLPAARTGPFGALVEGGVRCWAR